MKHLSLIFPALLMACTGPEIPGRGASLFAQNCATCHGADGTGGAQIPDLTRLAQGAGGVYPQVRVLDKLDGYARGQAAYAGSEMPNFGMLLTGPLTRVPLADGLSRELPEGIVALDAYLQRLQRAD